MGLIKILKPSIITLLTTYQCTAQCENCCFGCQRELTKSMEYEDMVYYINTCMKEFGDSIKVLVLTGGECMIHSERILRIIKYASSLQLSVRIVTNGFWATSYRRALTVLKDLVGNGLNEINFSTGNDHQKWVSLRNIRNAAVAAARLGLFPIINVEAHDSVKDNTISRLIRDKIFLKFVIDGSIKVEQGIWMSFSKNNNISHNNFLNVGRFDRCLNLFKIIPINPYGEVLACCGLVSEQNPYLRLGDVKLKSLKDIYESSFNDILKIWLYVEGPAKILYYISQRRNLPYKIHAVHICDICRTLFKNHSNIEFLRQEVKNYTLNVLLKYNLLTNCNL